MSSNNKNQSMNIKGIMPCLFEAGKVKIGRKGGERQKNNGQGTYQMPEKLDHFLITRTNRGRDNNFIVDEELMKSLPQDADGKVRRIPITLLYDKIELNFQSRMACYSGRTLYCSGDGETATQAIVDSNRNITGYKQVECPCPKSEFGYKGGAPCKMTGRLQFLIRGAERIGGVHMYRTAGRNSVVAIQSSLALIQRITGGYLAGIDLELVVSPKHVVDPDGKPQTVYLVAIEYAGSFQALQNQAKQFLLSNEAHRQNIMQIESEARAMLQAQPTPFSPVLDDDDQDEFFPHTRADLAEATPASSGIDDAIARAASQATVSGATQENQATSTKKDPAPVEKDSPAEKPVEKEPQEQLAQESPVTNQSSTEQGQEEIGDDEPPF